MEQLAPFIEGCKKHKFWIACGICAAAMLGVFIYSSMDVNKQKADRISTLNQKLQAVDSIRNQAFATDIEDVKKHPNTGTNQETEKEIQDGKDAAWKAWQLQYERQKKLLTWPVGTLGADGAAEFERQLEMELWNVPGQAGAATPRGARPGSGNTKKKDAVEKGHGDVMQNTRQLYQRFIKEHMPSVAKIIGATWKFDDSIKIDTQTEGGGRESGASGPGQSQAAGMQGIGGRNQDDPTAGIKFDTDTVIWDEDNQAYWNGLVTKFNGRNGNTSSIPTTAQIMATQQDLWILEALFRVVKEVNGDVKENDLVSIQRIDHVFTGLPAISTSPKVMRIQIDQEQNAGGARSRGRGGMGDVAGGRDKRGSRTVTNTTGSKSKFKPEASSDPIHGRYVNNNFEPMSEAEIRKAAKAAKLEADPEYSVAKRIPFRLGVVMDEREIDNFLAMCANSPFAIEVRQIRINRHQPNEVSSELMAGSNMGAGGNRGRNEADGGGTVSSAGLGSQSASGGGAGATSGTMTGIDGGRGAGAMGNRGGGTAGSGTSVATRKNYKIKVEFSGIVKIFYKPRPKLLNQKDEDNQDNSNQTNPIVASK